MQGHLIILKIDRFTALIVTKGKHKKKIVDSDFPDFFIRDLGSIGGVKISRALI
jgi:hypothetical protein